jgi:hypothetical protein
MILPSFDEAIPGRTHCLLGLSEHPKMLIRSRRADCSSLPSLDEAVPGRTLCLLGLSDHPKMIIRSRRTDCSPFPGLDETVRARADCLPVPSEFPYELIGIERTACHSFQNIRRRLSSSSTLPVQSFKARRKLIRFEWTVDMSLGGFDEKLRVSSWAVYPVSRPLRRAALLPGGPSAALRARKPAP